MPKVVVDTNVFLSGILFGGNPRKIITAWLGKQYILCISPELKSEIINKLHLKFDLPLATIEIIEDALDLYSEKYIPGKKINLCRDPNDNFLLELAQESRADYLISGDKLVLELKQYKSTKIITDWQKTAIFKSQMNAKRLHTSPALRESIDFLPPDVNLKDNTPAFKLEKFITPKEFLRILR